MHVTLRVVLVGWLASTAGTAATGPGALSDPKVDEILTRLEKRTVSDLSAKLRWENWHVIDPPDERSVKKGEILYKDRDPVPVFIVHFKKKSMGRRSQRADERHLFDGRWYVELNAETKTVTRREVRRPDDPASPYKIGEGPFPVPFGQKKADILREFEVRLDPPNANQQVPDPKDTDHLVLKPRPGTRSAERFKQLDFWIRRKGPESGLPVKVKVAKLDGTGRANDEVTVTFEKIRLNTSIPDDRFEVKTPRGYEEIRELLSNSPAVQEMSITPQPE